MALARAFTTIGRRNRKSDDGDTLLSHFHIGRAASTRGGRPVLCSNISSPMALVSTSNMQVRDAQRIPGTEHIDIHNISSASSASSVSGDESDGGSTSHSANEASYTDASSVDESPMRTEPEPNHLSCYFKPAVDTARLSTGSSRPASPSEPDAPVLPRRVPSHSKKAHERVHRTRSLRRMMSPPPSTAKLALSPSSPDMTANESLSFVEAPREEPFGPELAQVDEMAEEFGQVLQRAEIDAEAVYMETRGLALFSAADYMSEIQALVYETFGAPHVQNEAAPVGWI